MRPVLVVMFAALAGPALALPQSAREPEGLRIYSPTQFGVVAETPSRLAGSREEMNRGRNMPLARPCRIRPRTPSPAPAWFAPWPMPPSSAAPATAAP